MVLMTHLWRGSQILVLMGALSSWISAVTVNDARPADRRITTGLVLLPAILGMTLGTAVAGHALIEDPLFLVVLFTGVYVRRYGQRHTTLGIVWVFSFFFSLFIGARVDQLPPLFGALTLGTASTYVMRFVVPKYRRGSLWSVRQSILAQLRLAAAPVPHAALAVLVPHLAEINETILAVEEQGVIPASLERLILECELAAENLLIARSGEDVETRRSAERRFAEAIERFVAAVGTAPPPQDEEPGPQHTAIIEEARRGSQTQYRLRPTTRQAIQVTVAAAGAIAAGEHISPQRWYWAVIVTFIVYNGTVSAGETVVRAWASFLGTLAGVLAGGFIGHLVRGDVALESTLLFLGMLFAAYFLRRIYGVALFFITLVLVMLYSLTGRFTESLLLIRLFEVIIGAVIGGVAAVWILPTSTRRVFRGDVIASLQAMCDALEVLGGDDERRVQAASRRFDTAVRRLRQRVRPLRSGPTFAGFSEFARRWLWALELSAYHLRNAVVAPTFEREQVRAAAAKTAAILQEISSDLEWPQASAPLPELPPPRCGPGENAQPIAQIGELLARLS